MVSQIGRLVETISSMDQGHEAEACWSPDGKKIAFSSTRSGYWAIWIMEPDIQSIKDKLNLNN
jgi:Tol biopolymer transport system component